MEHVFSKNVGLGFIRGTMFPKHDSTNPLKYLQLQQSPQRWKCCRIHDHMPYIHSTKKLLLPPKIKIFTLQLQCHFQSPGSISCTLAPIAFQSMSDPSRVPAMHPASPQNFVESFPTLICVSCRLHAPIWPFSGSERDVVWHGCQLLRYFWPVVR